MTDSSRVIMLTNELVSCQSARKLQSAESCVDEQIIPQVSQVKFTHYFLRIMGVVNTAILAPPMLKSRHVL